MRPDPADYVARYSSAQVCQATGISPDTLRNWVSRKPQVVLLTDDDRDRAKRGVPISFSFNRVMQIAITAELVQLGHSPRSAALAAAVFTDTNMSSVDWQDIDADHRLPGQLFSDAWTFLVVPKQHDESRLAAECVRVTPKTTVIELIQGGILRFHDVSAFSLIHVDAVHNRVRAALRAASDKSVVSTTEDR